MLGKPKFNYGDKVQFTLSDGTTYKGSVYIIDRFGTFEDNTDVSYDIMVDDYNGKQCLFKHISERIVYEQ